MGLSTNSKIDPLDVFDPSDFTLESMLATNVEKNEILAPSTYSNRHAGQQFVILRITGHNISFFGKLEYLVKQS